MGLTTTERQVVVMESRMTTRSDFLQRYWRYYLLLEKDFLKTERYLAIDELNFSAFSDEYIKQYQTICSEIDVIAKSFCKELDVHFTGNTIDAYCKTIVDIHTDFARRVIDTKNRGIIVTPWKDWSYTIENRTNGTNKIVATNPDWWKKYNKIKHTRTTVNRESGLPYYKLANQKNVLYSLAALFQLEMYYHKLLQKNHYPNDIDIPEPASSLFEIQDWDSSWSIQTGIYFGSF